MHASESLYSHEIDILAKIDRFGLEAITGRRQFYFGELRRLIIAENIVTAYRSRARAENWASWSRESPVMANLLAEVEVLVNKDEN